MSSGDATKICSTCPIFLMIKFGLGSRPTRMPISIRCSIVSSFIISKRQSINNSGYGRSAVNSSYKICSCFGNRSNVIRTIPFISLSSFAIRNNFSESSSSRFAWGKNNSPKLVRKIDRVLRLKRGSPSCFSNSATVRVTTDGETDSFMAASRKFRVSEAMIKNFRASSLFMIVVKIAIMYFDNSN